MDSKETHKFMVPKMGTQRYELFTGYGYAEMKWTAIGIAFGIVVLLVIIGIQNIFFPYKKINIESVSYGVEYIKTLDPEIVEVERKIHSLVKTFIVLFFGAVFTIPNLKMNNHYTVIELIKLKNKFNSTQQLFQYSKSKYY